MGDGQDKHVFATLKPTFSDASSQLVIRMRATLRRAQEITTTVGEAELAAQRAQAKVRLVDSLTTEAERQCVDSEIQRLADAIYGRNADKVVNPPNLVSPPKMPGASEDPIVATETREGLLPSAPKEMLTTAQSGRASVPVAEQMAQEIETTVMWVQQLLECAHLASSPDAELEPGASLLKYLQPGRRYQKDQAVHKSTEFFHEKKEAEKEADERAVIFRGHALAAVRAKRQALLQEVNMVNIPLPEFAGAAGDQLAHLSSPV